MSGEEIGDQPDKEEDRVDTVNLKEKRQPFRIEVLEKMSTLIAAAFGFVAAFAWNEMLQDTLGNRQDQRDVVRAAGFSMRTGDSAAEAPHRLTRSLHVNALYRARIPGRTPGRPRCNGAVLRWMYPEYSRYRTYA